MLVKDFNIVAVNVPGIEVAVIRNPFPVKFLAMVFYQQPVGVVVEQVAVPVLPTACRIVTLATVLGLQPVGVVVVKMSGKVLPDVVAVWLLIQCLGQQPGLVIAVKGAMVKDPFPVAGHAAFEQFCELPGGVVSVCLLLNVSLIICVFGGQEPSWGVGVNCSVPLHPVVVVESINSHQGLPSGIIVLIAYFLVFLPFVAVKSSQYGFRQPTLRIVEIVLHLDQHPGAVLPGFQSVLEQPVILVVAVFLQIYWVPEARIGILGAFCELPAPVGVLHFFRPWI